MNIMKGIAGTGCLALPVAVKSVCVFLGCYIGWYYLGCNSLYCGISGVHPGFVPIDFDQ